MNGQTSFRRTVAISAIISAPVATSSWVLVALAVGPNSEAVSDLANMNTLVAPAAGYLHPA